MDWLKDWWKVLTGVLGAGVLVVLWVARAEEAHRKVPQLEEAVQAIQKIAGDQRDRLCYTLVLCRTGELNPNLTRCKLAEVRATESKACEEDE